MGQMGWGACCNKNPHRCRATSVGLLSWQAQSALLLTVCMREIFFKISRRLWQRVMCSMCFGSAS